ncbi:MAG: hypothetical protein E7277_01975 [Lachnospiraceae bacterium]|nr:hypothetical protein [Lachnospiraceae bacterium]
MIINVCCFSEEGEKRAKELLQKEKNHLVRIRKEEPIRAFVEHAFFMHEGLLFIGACGIAVRMIAPFVEDKRTDSPVVVMDEVGKYCISLLSGHLGGANELCRHVAELLQVEPVITTATDVHGAFAVDVFARQNQLDIAPKEGIRKVSTKVLTGEVLRVACEDGIGMEGVLPAQIEIVPWGEAADIAVSGTARQVERATVTLYARPLCIGMGCRKEVPFARLEAFTRDLPWEEIACVSSIDRKKMESGLQELASFHQVPYVTYSAEELDRVTGAKAESSFVKETVGVSNVCENSALLAAGEGAILEIEKVAENGMTYAVARKGKITLKW